MDTADREIVITRTVNAPRDLVWDAWMEQDHLEQWWGPNGFSVTTQSIDICEGGHWQFIMHGPDGQDYPNFIKFTKIVKPERIENDHGTDAESIEFRAIVTFEEQDGKTVVTMRTVFPTKEALDVVVREHDAIEGGKQTLGRLAAYTETR